MDGTCLLYEAPEKLYLSSHLDEKALQEHHAQLALSILLVLLSLFLTSFIFAYSAVSGLLLVLNGTGLWISYTLFDKDGKSPLADYACGLIGDHEQGTDGCTALSRSKSTDV